MTRTAVVTHLAALATGAALGWVDPSSVVEDPRADRSAATSPIPIPPPERQPCVDDVRWLRSALARREVAHDAEVRRIAGAPIPFPPEFRGTEWDAPAVEASVLAIDDRCPDVDLPRPYVDCEEFPCLVWLPEDGGFDYAGCWRDYPLSVVLGGGVLHAERGGAVPYILRGVAPEAWSGPADRERRIYTRRYLIDSLVAEAWDPTGD